MRVWRPGLNWLRMGCIVRSQCTFGFLPILGISWSTASQERLFFIQSINQSQYEREPEIRSRNDQDRCRGSILHKSSRFFCARKCSERLWTLPSPQSVGSFNLFLWVKWAEHVASTAVMNEWSCTSQTAYALVACTGTMKQNLEFSLNIDPMG